MHARTAGVGIQKRYWVTYQRSLQRRPVSQSRKQTADAAAMILEEILANVCSIAIVVQSD
jgi:hypothetical protein